MLKTIDFYLPKKKKEKEIDKDKKTAEELLGLPPSRLPWENLPDNRQAQADTPCWRRTNLFT